jgi:UDP-N-acetylmuramate dehydrogenase
VNIRYNRSLKPFNTFGIDVNAKEFVEVTTFEGLQVLLSMFDFSERNILVLGGGSNVLLTRDIGGMVIRIAIKGIELLREDDEYVWVKAAAGEVWHDFVMYCIDHNYAGVENLSLIPGCVGAAPMQNIGAYGVELKDVFHSLEALEIETAELVEFDKQQCRFGYRESVFKQEAKGKYIIVAVTFRLSKKPHLNTSYGAIRETLEKKGITNPGIRDVSEAVMEIRRSKLPDPAVIGNAGSFFKNPEIPDEQFVALKEKHPGIVGYPASPGNTKLAAGWLIEQCGWKGKRVGNTGSHKDQALVLVNFGDASGDEIQKLSSDIRQSVFDRFGIDIQPEVNII